MPLREIRFPRVQWLGPGLQHASLKAGTFWGVLDLKIREGIRDHPEVEMIPDFFIPPPHASAPLIIDACLLMYGIYTTLIFYFLKGLFSPLIPEHILIKHL